MSEEPPETVVETLETPLETPPEPPIDTPEPPAQTPEPDEMTEEAARAWLEAYIAATGKSREAVGRALGVSGAMVSRFLGSKYEQWRNLIPKILQLQALSEKRKIAPKDPPFALTELSQRVLNVITFCHMQNKIGVVYGDAGVGKTMAVREYVRQTPLALAIELASSFGCVSGLAELLAEKLNLSVRHQRRVFIEAKKKLQGSSRVLILDEAQHLKTPAIEYARALAEQSGVGLALVGNERIYANMLGTRQQDFAQLFSRIADRAAVYHDQIQLKDIALIFGPVGLDQAALETLHAISRTNHGIRGAVGVYTGAVILFQIETGEDLTAERLLATAKARGIS